MKRELLLHIGTTKTGSTSIQNVLSRCRPALLEQGVCYPRVPGRVQHTLLVYAVMRPEDRVKRFRDIEHDGADGEPGAAEVFLRDFARELDDLPESVTRVIISSEFIYIHLQDPAEVRALRDVLAQWFDPIKIVVYLRRQDAHLTSLYSQMLRAGLVRAPNEFQMRERPLHELDYAELLQRWADVFGRENIEPRLFERGAPDRRFDVVEDFCTMYSIRIPEVGHAIRESNPSIEIAGQELLAELGKFIQQRTNSRKVGSPVWRRLTQAVTHACQGPGWKPARSEAEEFYNRYRQSNDAVRRVWFPDRPTLFAEDFSEYPETAMSASLDGRYAAACRTILALAEHEHSPRSRSADAKVEQAKADKDPKHLRFALRRLARTNEDDPTVRAMLAEVLIDGEKVREARIHAAAALQLSPDDPEIRALNERVLTLAASAAPVHEKARETTRKRSREQPDGPESENKHRRRARQRRNSEVANGSDGAKPLD